MISARNSPRGAPRKKCKFYFIEIFHLSIFVQVIHM